MQTVGTSTQLCIVHWVMSTSKGMYTLVVQDTQFLRTLWNCCLTSFSNYLSLPLSNHLLPFKSSSNITPIVPSSSLYPSPTPIVLKIAPSSCIHPNNSRKASPHRGTNQFTCHEMVRISMMWRASSNELRNPTWSSLVVDMSKLLCIFMYRTLQVCWGYRRIGHCPIIPFSSRRRWLLTPIGTARVCEGIVRIWGLLHHTHCVFILYPLPQNHTSSPTLIPSPSQLHLLPYAHLLCSYVNLHRYVQCLRPPTSPSLGTACPPTCIR